MVRRIASVEEKIAAARARYLQRRGKKLQPKPPNTSIAFGSSDNGLVELPATALTRHMHVIGTTSAGKSNFLEVTIRQMIEKGYGVCLLDPHGGHSDGLYNKVLGWLAGTKTGEKLVDAKRLHLIEPNKTSHVTGFNPLALPNPDTAVSVVAGAMLDAIERVWGDEQSHSKPTIRRVLKGTFHALAELGLTLAEIGMIFDDPHDQSGFRADVLRRLHDPYARSVLERIDRLGRDARSTAEYDAETIGAINRVAEFLSTDVIRLMVGQTESTLDFSEILDEGHVLLVDLQEGDQVGVSETNLLGRMLLHTMFLHAKRRKNTSRPFFMVIDECHRMLSGDVAHILSEARKFGLGLTLGHQYLAQIGEVDEQIESAVRNNCATKVVSRIEDTDEAMALANNVVPLDLEMPVQSLIAPTAIGQEVVRLTGEGHSRSRVESIAKAVAEATAISSGSSFGTGSGSVAATHSGEVVSPDQGWLGMGQVINMSSGTSVTDTNTHMHATMESTTQSLAESVAEGLADGKSVSSSVSEALETVYEDTARSVHSKDNVLYMAARTLRSLDTGSAFVSHRAMASIMDVPLASAVTSSVSDTDVFRLRVFENSPASIPMDEARAQLTSRANNSARASPESVKDDVDIDDVGEPMSFREPAPRGPSSDAN